MNKRVHLSRPGNLHRRILCHPSGRPGRLGAWLQEAPHPVPSQCQHLPQTGRRGQQHHVLWQPPQQRDKQGGGPGPGLQAQCVQRPGRARAGEAAQAEGRYPDRFSEH